MARPIACVLAPLALGGCFWIEWFRPLAASASDWYEVGPIRRPPQEIMKAAEIYLSRAGYVVPPYDPRERRFETDWDVRLSSHWREGHRTKVEVEFAEARDGSTMVRIRSYREFNEESKHPMVESRAAWVGATVDEKQAPLVPLPAIKLQQHLKMKFMGLGDE